MYESLNKNFLSISPLSINRIKRKNSHVLKTLNLNCQAVEDKLKYKKNNIEYLREKKIGDVYLILNIGSDLTRVII